MHLTSGVLTFIARLKLGSVTCRLKVWTGLIELSCNQMAEINEMENDQIS